VKVDEGVDEELIDDITEGRAAQGGTEAGEDLCGGGIDAWIVEDREGGTRGVARDQGEVGDSFAAVGTGDDAAGAGVEDPLEEGVTGTHDVITRVLMIYGSEEGVAEDAVGDAVGDNSTESLAEGRAIGSVVGPAVRPLLKSRGCDPSSGGEERYGALETGYNLVSHRHRIRNFIWRDDQLHVERIAWR
jgi:hypothetical protein